jgi:hypothetical protein
MKYKKKDSVNVNIFENPTYIVFNEVECLTGECVHKNNMFGIPCRILTQMTLVFGRRFFTYRIHLSMACLRTSLKHICAVKAQTIIPCSVDESVIDEGEINFIP